MEWWSPKEWSDGVLECWSAGNRCPLLPIPFLQLILSSLHSRFALCCFFQDRVISELASVYRCGTLIDVGHHSHQVLDGGRRRHQIDGGAGAHLLVAMVQGFFLVRLYDLSKNFHGA